MFYMSFDCLLFNYLIYRNWFSIWLWCDSSYACCFCFL